MSCNSFCARPAELTRIVKAYVKGTVNDPTTYPPPSKFHGSYHWTFERLLSASLIPVVGATFVTSPHPVLDGILAVTLVVHSHMVRLYSVGHNTTRD
jgi:succinate dehydrogenase (ubiquinone) membrane anchor subunit